MQTVVYDACVLFPATLRDLLMRVAVARLVRAKWTDRILDECFRSITRHRPELPLANLERTRRLMNLALDEPLITGYEPINETVTLPDPDDRHVVAAAIRAGAQVVVTANLKDFPATELTRHSLVAMAPDDFILGLADRASSVMVRVVTDQAAALRNPPHTVSQLLDTLHSHGLARSIARLREIVAR